MTFRLFFFLSPLVRLKFLNLSAFCMMLFGLACSLPPTALAAPDVPDPLTAAADRPTGKACRTPLSAVTFYIVMDGRLETRTLTRNELANASFQTDGYVSGIVAVGEKGIDARVDGRPMSAVQPGADGTFSFGYYGRIKPEQLVGTGQVEEKKGMFGADVYSCFPVVPADTLSGSARFLIELETGDAPWRLEVRHNGGRNISGSEPGRDDDVVPFRYVGSRDRFMEGSDPELVSRMAAVSRGIRAVESVFRTDLVDTVHLLDFEEIRNAVTCLNENDIWFYIKTFQEEPINELSVIAEHEALHILVDRLSLTRNMTVRKLFADLKGHHALSAERFRIVSQGRTSSRYRMKKGEHGYFFDFISERHFLNGMKGGHPQEDLDEFCTSFLHTLMYMDRFEANLGNLGTREKDFVMQSYIQLLDVVRRQLNPRDTVAHMTGTGFVSEQLDRVKALNQPLQALHTGSGPGDPGR